MVPPARGSSQASAARARVCSVAASPLASAPTIASMISLTVPVNVGGAFGASNASAASARLVSVEIAALVVSAAMRWVVSVDNAEEVASNASAASARLAPTAIAVLRFVISVANASAVVIAAATEPVEVLPARSVTRFLTLASVLATRGWKL